MAGVSSEKVFDVQRAVELAVEAHAGQVDRGRPHLPYVTHPLRVMCRFDDPELAMIAVLHDAVEDSAGGVSVDRLRAEGAPPRVVEAIEVLTRSRNEPYDDYLRRIRGHPDARAVKFQDIGDNADPRRLDRLEAGEAARLREKYRNARRLLYEGDIDRVLVPTIDVEVALTRYAAADVEADARAWAPGTWLRIRGFSDQIERLAQRTLTSDIHGRDRHLLPRRMAFASRAGSPLEQAIVSMIFCLGGTDEDIERAEALLTSRDAETMVARATDLLRERRIDQAHALVLGWAGEGGGEWVSTVLYFAGFDPGGPGPQPLILGRGVAAALRGYGIDVDAETTDDYANYLRLADSWARHLRLPRADLVELALSSVA